jgi:cell wall-associated NlpC family hydrolase
MGGGASAQPTEQELADARARLQSLNEHLSLLVEQFDVARIRLREAETRLAEARAAVSRSLAEASAALEDLSKRAALAYTTSASSVEMLLGAQDYADFAARVEFLATLAQQDADAATLAEVKRRQYERAGADFADAVRERQALVETLERRKAEIQAGIGQQRDLIRELEAELARQAAREAAAKAAAREAAARSAVASNVPEPEAGGGGGGGPGGGGGGGSGGGSGGGGDPSPPPPSSLADIAVAAAYDALGVPYVWGGSSPQEGFDCSGLTMWSWAHAGVSLPHSSQMQYDVLPHVSRDQIQPGDLLFFYQPISHVAIYVGGNQMIHATHPGTLSSLDVIADYWWAEYVGAGRPG